MKSFLNDFRTIPFSDQRQVTIEKLFREAYGEQFATRATIFAQMDLLQQNNLRTMWIVCCVCGIVLGQ